MVNNEHWADGGHFTQEFNEAASKTDPDPEVGEHENPEDEPVLGLHGGPPPPGFAFDAGQAHGGFDQGHDEEMEFHDPEGYNNENIDLTFEFNEAADIDLPGDRDD